MYKPIDSEFLPPGISLDCTEESIGNGEFCIFHDENQYAQHEQEAVKRFEEKVKESISRNEPLVCFGYYLPNVDLAMAFTTFEHSVYFRHATFYRESNFPSTTFSKGADFTDAVFLDKIRFLGCTFSERANFSHSVFLNDGSFSDNNFSKGADFSDTMFLKEASFMYATFSEKAFFFGAMFSKAIFIDTIFIKQVGFDFATFCNEPMFHGAKFSSEATFERTVFNSNAYFEDSKIFGNTNFAYVDFKKDAIANFVNVVFCGHSDFRYVKFGDRIYFTGAKFKETQFIGSVFENDADFRGAEFTGEAELYSIHFKQNALFAGSRFTQKAWFTSTRFNDANFQLTEFADVAFVSATFTKALFDNTSFEGEADFTSASFQEAIFSNKCIFKKKTEFPTARFQVVKFMSTEFTKSSHSNFSGAFFGEVLFVDTKFDSKTINFAQARFNDANFAQTSFKEKTEFVGVRFQYVSFTNTTFESNVTFYLSTFGRAKFSQVTFNDGADFTFVLFEDGEKILFDVADLSLVSFENTDVTRVRFGKNVRWGIETKGGFKVIDEKKIEESIRNPQPLLSLFDWNNIAKTDGAGDRDRKALKHFLEKNFGRTINKDGIEKIGDKKIQIYTEGNDNETRESSIILNRKKDRARLKINGKIVYEFVVEEEEQGKEQDENKEPKLQLCYPQNGNDISLSSVLTVYRNIRENYEYSLRYEEADKFYICEMDLKRNYREVKPKATEKHPPIKRNDWFRKNLSLTGLYYHLSRYGQDYKRPALIATAFIALQIFFAVLQADIKTSPSLSYDYLAQVENVTESSLSKTFQLGDNEEFIDFFFRIATIPILGTLVIAALKRTFEKKFRHK